MLKWALKGSSGGAKDASGPGATDCNYLLTKRAKLTDMSQLQMTPSTTNRTHQPPYSPYAH